MCTHLTKRNSTYYFRRAIPTDLRPYLDGRTEWMVSLGTKDRETAKRAVPKWTIETDELLAKAKAELVRVRKLNGPLTVAQMGRRDLEMARQEADEKQRARREGRADLRSFLAKRMMRTTAELTPMEAAMKDLLVGASGQSDHSPDEVQRFSAEADAGRAPWQPKTAPRAMSPSDSCSDPVPILETFDAYTKAQGVSPSVTAEWRAVMAKLISFIGHDDAAKLTTKDLMLWRDVLLAEVSPKGKQRTPVTVNGNYLGAVRAMLAWAVDEHLLAENVASTVRARQPKPIKLRERDFTLAEAEAILSASLRPIAADVSDETRRARRWIPWICAYTGARVNEISQLRVEDIAEREGIWSILITPEAGTVKTNEARTVPIHPHLIEQGFLDAVRASETERLFYAPERQRADGVTTRHFKKVGERLAKWVRDEVGITDPGVKPNHAWRHTFKTQATAVGIDEKVSDAITGHAPATVGRRYGQVSLATKAEAIARLPRYEV